MIASFSITRFSSIDTCFFKISTAEEELSLQFQTFRTDKPMIAFSSSSNFLSTDFVKSLITSNSFMKISKLEISILEISQLMCSTLFSRFKGSFRSMWYFQ